MKNSDVFLAGEWKSTGKILDVINPFTQQVAFQTGLAGADEAGSAIQSAEKAISETRKLPAWKKYEILHFISRKISERRQEIAQTICAEAGKPIQYALGEVDRSVITFSLAADWVRNWKGHVIPLDLSAPNNGKMGIVKHFPVGIVLAISPFNFPLNLVAHKLAPAIAAGNPIILKPASKTPKTALILAGIIAESGWPAAALSVLPCSRETGQLLVQDPRIHLLSFTGSPDVGWELKAASGKKKVVLELGGDAAVIVDQSADLQDAAKKCVWGAFAYAGQICISVQRIIVHKTVFDEFRSLLREETAKVFVGDPANPQTVVGPMVDAKNKNRIQDWIQEAKSGGAEVYSPIAEQAGNLVSPVILENVPRKCKISDTEAFAPIVNLYSAENMDDAIAKVNDSRYGLQAGIFTDSQTSIRKAFEELHLGGVLVNQAPTVRVDSMPYGGIKDSGLGREGLEYAIQEMLEMKVLVW